MSLKCRKLLPLIAVALLFFHITGIINIKREEKNVPVMADSESSRVLIIDAGHGGADGGAVAPNGTLESGINLSIALKLYNLSRIFGVNTLMTRDSEDLLYPESAKTIREMKRWDQKQRLELINSSKNAVLISIHQNNYPDPRPFGPQVFYGGIDGSEELGNLCHQMLNERLCPENRRLAMPASKDIYLMKNAKCSSILVECGFLSNKDELSKLCSEDYQRKLAAIILSAYMNCY